MRPSSAYHFVTDDLLQSAEKYQQESRAVTGKPHTLHAVVKFDTYVEIYSGIARVLLAIARLSCSL